MVPRPDVATSHQGACEHAEESSQVHDELTLLNLSHIQRVEESEHVSTEERRADHDIQNAEPMTSLLPLQVACAITKPDVLPCEGTPQSAFLFDVDRSTNGVEHDSDVFQLSEVS